MKDMLTVKLRIEFDPDDGETLDQLIDRARKEGTLLRHDAVTTRKELRRTPSEEDLKWYNMQFTDELPEGAEEVLAALTGYYADELPEGARREPDDTPGPPGYVVGLNPEDEAFVYGPINQNLAAGLVFCLNCAMPQMQWFAAIRSDVNRIRKMAAERGFPLREDMPKV